jgi:hypothetical protein
MTGQSVESELPRQHNSTSPFAAPQDGLDPPLQMPDLTRPQEVFELFEMFHNPKRKHTKISVLSPINGDVRWQKQKVTGFKETRATSVARQGPSGTFSP